MSAIGTGYDLSASQFSPDGRVFQVEYAAKAVENSGTAIALKGKDGVVLAVEKLVTSKLYEPGTNKKIFKIDMHITAAVAGLLADARSIIKRAREEASVYRSTYGLPIPITYLKNRVAMYMHAYTLYSALRPFGCSVIFASYDELDGPQLFCLDPSGVSWGYKGCAVGKNKQAARTELEKLKFADLNMKVLVKEASRIIHMVHDDVKDKPFELEMAWVGKETGGKHQWMPKEIHDEAVKYAQDILKQQSDSEDESAS